jgi:hypothetical protein
MTGERVDSKGRLLDPPAHYVAVKAGDARVRAQRPAEAPQSGRVLPVRAAS